MANCRTYIIQENDHVFLKKADKLRLFKVQRGRTIWLDKAKFTLDGTIGHPYGSLFEVKDETLVKIERQKTETNTDEKGDKGLDSDKDNRNLHDLDSNQRLTADEIVQMKKEGVTGGELIEQLIENSTTFQNKTEYAQAKWVKKKQKKHVLEFTVLKPNSRLLCDMYVSKGPSKICNLRIDSLAQILTYGNVRAHSTVAVFDTCLGLVTGAVLERLGGFGKVINFYYGDSPMKSQLDAFDFPKEVMDTLYQFPLEQINSLKSCNLTENIEVNKHVEEGTQSGEPSSSVNDTKMKTNKANINKRPIVISIEVETDITESISESNGTNQDKQQDCDSVSSDSNRIDCVKYNESNNQADITVKDESETHQGADSIENRDDAKKDGNQKRRNKKKRPNIEDRVAAKARAKEIEAAKKIILEKNIDCLIIACKFHPTPIVTSLVDYLAPSRQVVVYSQFKEALQDCYVHMREHGSLVSFRLSETWLRNYQKQSSLKVCCVHMRELGCLLSFTLSEMLLRISQILPNRTHPVIQMSGTGGYLLTATTVIKPE